MPDSSCDFSQAQQLAASTNGGNYSIVPQAVGTYYVACSIGSHCNSGMKLAVTVVPPPRVPQTVDVDWTIPATPNTINIVLGDSLRFQWSSFHDIFLMADKSCNFQIPGVQNLAPPSSNGDFIVTPSSPGTYNYACSIGGHCAAGMKIQVRVLGIVGPLGSAENNDGADQSASTSTSHLSVIFGVGTIALVAVIGIGLRIRRRVLEDHRIPPAQNTEARLDTLEWDYTI